jgi:hypothetical protein
MTLREIDDALGAWNSRLGAAAQNLMDLQSEPTYQQLTGTGGMQKAPITGVTKARVEPALGAMATMFQHFSLLNATIDRANLLRRNVPTLFGADQKLREIEELLSTRSVHLPAVDVPLEQRGLLSGMQNVQCISPSELLDTMVHAFQAAKEAVVAVDTAWNQLGSGLGKTTARIAALRARASGLGGPPPAELDAAERGLLEIRATLLADPLGASGGMEARIQPLLERVEAAVTARERLRQEIVHGLSAARPLIDELAKLHCAAIAACTEAKEKIAGCGPLPGPQPDQTIEGLREWLERLEKKYAEASGNGTWDPVGVGVRNWNLAAQDCVSKERAVLAANRAPIETRDELRGRLDAFQAKARSYGIAEDERLVEQAKLAEQLLYARPMLLDRALAAVVAYEKAVNGARKQNESGGVNRQ